MDSTAAGLWTIGYSEEQKGGVAVQAGKLIQQEFEPRHLDVASLTAT